ncbi:type II toxin-antitoxin system HipA family toxin YjjJ [Yersinia pekkanenii]|uniref:DNA-binding transcriptional regulator n=1 Tax=Yersinia pekkanenii TaxID=1288385 RepID=A0A0T9NW39_9GAMM|nr:type II toxin-antitoxin system HipA family toxin YjjJ [Yersinia pekkanenii]CNH31369.1 putative DNA-binding transcriptional regulator [Yersinia pekkanenii]CRY63072.1 putative DNA-binding transcriptional regulator [Yersinia pekkanenii]
MPTLEMLLRQGPTTANSLAQALATSQSTISRQLTALKERVLKIGKGKSTHYALLRSVAGVGEFPLYRIDGEGNASHFAHLYPIYPAEMCCVHQLDDDTWQQFDSLPWYLADMRPQGFLGRIWGKSVAEPLQLDRDIRGWNEEHILIALSRMADDVNGNILLGQESYQHWLLKPDAVPIPPLDKPQRYKELSLMALAGEMVGSSAGGEQPKFTCYAGYEGKPPSYVIVKFTVTPDNPNAQRWADLLIAESLALNTLKNAGYSAAASHILQHQDKQTFLEVERFDRQGQRGRVGMVSLEAVNAEFVGMPVASWPKVCRELALKGLLDIAELEQVRLIWAFGILIANTDMHHGNLSFLHLANRPLSLAPIYDMLPMAFAPSGMGNMRQTVPDIRLSADVSREHWGQAQQLATQYWDTLSSDPNISAGFKAIAGQMQEKLFSLTPLIKRMA